MMKPVCTGEDRAWGEPSAERRHHAPASAGQLAPSRCAPGDGRAARIGICPSGSI